MPRFLRIALPLLAVLFLAGAITLFLTRPTPRPALSPDPEVTTLSFPPFTLTTQDPSKPPITRDTFLGHLTVVDFMFTNCPFVCPIMTETMGKVSRDLVGTPVRFLSISVDPAHDSPGALRDFAKLHNADLSRWTFATAYGAPHAEETLNAILVKGLMFGLASDPKTQINLPPDPAHPDQPKTMANITHPAWFVLVGPDAKVLGIYLSSDPDQIQALEKRALAAAQEMNP